MAKRMLIDALHPEETRVVIADENQIYDFDFVSTAKKQVKGNIYLAKITRVEPSLQAAFVEYGGGKQGFLPFSEIHADYYQIPVSDRKRLMEEAAGEPATESAEAQVQPQPSSGDESYGQRPITEQLGESSGNTGQTLLPESSAEDNALSAEASESQAPAMTESENAHPAYLTEGAIDISVSEDIEPAEDTEPQQGTEPLSTAAGEQTASAETDATPEESKSAEAPAAGEEVETIASEEDEYQNRPRKNVFLKRYKIQEVIRRGQIVLVQVIKEERGNKGVSLTTYLSLAGRYCVLMPNSPKDGGVSRKIASNEDRKRLKAIYTELKLAQGMSVIIRTAGMDRTRAEIKRDYDYLVKLWNQIREDTLKSNAPALIYEESDIIKRAIRDQYSSDIDDLVVEGDAGYKAAKEFMKLLLPSHTPKIKHYKEPTPLFYAYNIEEQLLSMHDPVVKLRSGGYIVMNPTEALISIDVNSGRATGERNIEETATKTNLEAVAEIARQLRLRDLAGLIVIDLIDMLESRNRRAVEKALKDALKADRAKIQMGRISPFGLLEMSRQRLRPSISETNMVQCPHCIGRGVIRSNESMSIQMIRAIEKEASAGVWSTLKLIVPQNVALHLLNHKRDILRAIEQRHTLTVQVLIGADLTASEFNLEKVRRSQEQRQDRDNERRPRRPERERERPRFIEDNAGNDNVKEAGDTAAAREEPFGGEDKRRGRRNRRGGRGRRDRTERTDFNAVADKENLSVLPESEVMQAEPVESLTPPAEGEERPAQQRSGRPPRQRGGRGRRRWRDRDGREPRHDRNDHDRNDKVTAFEPAQERWNEPAAAASDGNTLPAFATEDRLPVTPAVPRPEPVVPKIESTPRDPNAPSKKGWWQKMIELDD